MVRRKDSEVGHHRLLQARLWIPLDRRRIRNLYDEKVGLDLAGLVALLPGHLQDKEYIEFMLSPKAESVITVGLVHRDESAPKRVGNPLNVGISFDIEDGHVLRVHEGGVGLGLK